MCTSFCWWLCLLVFELIGTLLYLLYLMIYLNSQYFILLLEAKSLLPFSLLKTSLPFLHLLLKYRFTLLKSPTGLIDVALDSLTHLLHLLQ